jgi:hypothetical protein
VDELLRKISDVRVSINDLIYYAEEAMPHSFRYIKDLILDLEDFVNKRYNEFQVHISFLWTCIEGRTIRKCYEETTAELPLREIYTKFFSDKEVLKDIFTKLTSEITYIMNIVNEVVEETKKLEEIREKVKTLGEG